MGKTYRPKSNVLFGVLWVVFMLFLFVGQWSTPMSVVGRTLVLSFLACFTFVFARFTIMGVRTSDRGIRVVNTYESFDLEWRQIERFRVGRKRRFLSNFVRLIDLVDGSTKHVAAYGEKLDFPNGPVKQVAAELNAELRQSRR